MFRNWLLFVLQAEEDDGIGISDSQAAMLEAKIDPVEWKRELERVGPRLKVNARDSRARRGVWGLEANVRTDVITQRPHLV